MKTDFHSANSLKESKEMEIMKSEMRKWNCWVVAGTIRFANENCTLEISGSDIYCGNKIQEKKENI